MTVELCGMPSARPFDLEGGEHLFVVRREDFISFDRKTLRERAGIRWEDCGEYDDENAYAFNEKELRLVLAGLDLIVVERKGTEFANVEMVKTTLRSHLTSILPPAMVAEDPFLSTQVQTATWHGRSSNAFAYLIGRTLGPVLKRKIIINVPHGRQCDYDDRSAFHFHILSTSSGWVAQEHRPPNRIWGIELVCREHVFRPSSEDVPGALILDGTYPVAELLPNALYVHHDLVEYGHRTEFEITKRLCEEAATLLANVELLADLARREIAFREANQTRMFMLLVTKAIPAKAEGTQAALAEAKEEAEEARKVLLQAERIVFGLEHARKDPKVVADKFAAEFEKLRTGGVSCIKTAEIIGTSYEPRLRLSTTEIVALDRRTKKLHLLGHYEIDFNFQDGEVRFRNLDRIVEDCHGPHIDEEGEACLGNIHRELLEYIAHFEIEAAVVLAIAFLQNPNPDDSNGNRVSGYPLFTGESDVDVDAEDEGAEVAEAAE